MKVFKFGGASLKDVPGIQRVASIIKTTSANHLLVVVSAMGKTTNALEKILSIANAGQSSQSEIDILQEYHVSMMNKLFTSDHAVFADVNNIFLNIKKELARNADFDLLYDQVVSQGELISSIIVHHYLIDQGITSTWLDARSCITTDNCFREGKVDWNSTTEKISKLRNTLNQSVIVTQGFIGQTPEGLTTTLGREGSDFSAAIFASSLSAESVTIWKDVPGVMNADPKRLPAAVVFDELPFKEAAEMTYYGASVIHPKTIKPLANKGISLLVKNFENPQLPGTIIHECTVDHLPPLIVFKDNQCLVSCKVTDYTFINEQQMLLIFRTLSELDLHVNLMQNSAITFSFCLDFRENKVIKLIQQLQQHFEVYYNTGLTLITVKNYDQETFDTYRKKEGILLEQSSRSTLQVLVRP